MTQCADDTKRTATMPVFSPLFFFSHAPFCLFPLIFWSSFCRLPIGFSPFLVVFCSSFRRLSVVFWSSSRSFRVVFSTSLIFSSFVSCHLFVFLSSSYLDSSSFVFFCFWFFLVYLSFFLSFIHLLVIFLVLLS